MKLLGLYKSKKYLQRVLLKIMMSMVFVSISLSITNEYILEQTVNRVVQEANIKVLSHLNYNLSYMNSIITNMANSIYNDNRIIPLMYGDVPEMDLIRGYQTMYNNVQLSPFLDSITVYNSKTDDFYGTADSFFTEAKETKQKLRQWLFDPNNKIPKAQLIPMSLENTSESTDVFSLVISNSLQFYAKAESCIILNIKSDWVFDGLKKVNDMKDSERSNIFIMDQEGVLYSSDKSASLQNESGNKTVQQMILSDQSAGSKQEGFIIGNIQAKKSIVTYMSAGIRNWTIINIQPYDQVMAEMIQTREKSILLSGVFLFLAVILSFWISHKLYHPIESMLSRIKLNIPGGFRPGTENASDELSLMSAEYAKLSGKLNEITVEQIAKKYYLRKFLMDSQMFSHNDMMELIAKNELAVTVKEELLVCVLTIDHYAEYNRKTSHSQKKIYCFAIVNIVNEILSREYSCEAVDIRGDHFGLIISKRDRESTFNKMIPLLQETQETIFKYYGVSLTCGISDEISDLQQLSDCYSQAMQLSLYKMVYGFKSIVASELVQENMANEQFAIPASLERKLSEALKKGSMSEAEAELETVFTLIAKFHYDHMLRAVLNMTWLIKNTLNEISDNRVIKITADMKFVNQTLQEKETLEEMYIILISLCAEICENRKPVSDERNDMLVEAIKELIEQTYMDINLCQQSIAEAVHLSSAYVGKIFKNHGELSITEYINEVRLKQAQQMLKKDDRTIVEIMEKCGYANPSYFFRLFKQKFGSTPKEYRLKRLMSQDSK